MPPVTPPLKKKLDDPTLGSAKVRPMFNHDNVYSQSSKEVRMLNNRPWLSYLFCPHYYHNGDEYAYSGGGRCVTFVSPESVERNSLTQLARTDTHHSPCKGILNLGRIRKEHGYLRTNYQRTGGRGNPARHPHRTGSSNGLAPVQARLSSGGRLGGRPAFRLI